MEKQLYKLPISPKPNNSIKYTSHKVERPPTNFESHVPQNNSIIANSFLVVYATTMEMCEEGTTKIVITVQNVVDSVRTECVTSWEHI